MLYILCERNIGDILPIAYMIGTRAECLRYVLENGMRRKNWYLTKWGD